MMWSWEQKTATGVTDASQRRRPARAAESTVLLRGGEAIPETDTPSGPEPDTGSESTSGPLNETWPDHVRESAATLHGLTDAEISGTTRLGDLAFTQAPAILSRVKDVLVRIGQEDFAKLPSAAANGLAGEIQGLHNDVAEMITLKSSDGNAPQKRQQLASNFENKANALCDLVFANDSTYRVRALLESEAAAVKVEAALRDEIQALRAEALSVQASVEEAQRRLKEIDPLVNERRAEVSSDAARELATNYDREAERHASAWPWALVCLVGTAAVAVLAAWALFSSIRPDDDASNADLVGYATLALVVLGVLLFGIRVASTQFRAHRHQEAVARNKAAALRTFSDLVAGPVEPEVRSQVAAVLAQSIFSSHDTGFGDGAGDGVTVIERVASSLPSSRPGSP